MRALAFKEKLRVTNTLSTLLNELDEECLKTIKLVSGLRIEGLTDKQLDEMLGELSAAVTHLRIHSEQVERAIEEELDKE